MGGQRRKCERDSVSDREDREWIDTHKDIERRERERKTDGQREEILSCEDQENVLSLSFSLSVEGKFTSGNRRGN